VRSRSARTEPVDRGIETKRVPAGPGASRTCSPISRADARTGRLAVAAGGGRDGDAIEESVGTGVVGAEDAAGDADDDAAGTGAGLVGGAQAATSRPIRPVAAIRDSEGRIPIPS